MAPTMEIAGEPYLYLCEAVHPDYDDCLILCTREEDHPGPHRVTLQWDNR